MTPRRVRVWRVWVVVDKRGRVVREAETGSPIVQRTRDDAIDAGKVHALPDADWITPVRAWLTLDDPKGGDDGK